VSDTEVLRSSSTPPMFNGPQCLTPNAPLRCIGATVVDHTQFRHRIADTRRNCSNGPPQTNVTLMTGQHWRTEMSWGLWRLVRNVADHPVVTVAAMLIVFVVDVVATKAVLAAERHAVVSNSTTMIIVLAILLVSMALIRTLIQRQIERRPAKAPANTRTGISRTSGANGSSHRG
jgi:hypothetical protein